MQNMNIPFFPPDLDVSEVSDVAEILRSGWNATGQEVTAFERKIAQYCHAEKAVCLSSATAGMELVLHLLGIGEGDEVIVPAYTHTATASVVCHVGAKLVMVDSAPNAYTMDLEKLERAITPRTKVIIPVDLAGIVCDYEPIFRIVEQQKAIFAANSRLQQAFGRIVVMADAAHAFGAQQNGRMCGEIADFTAFSLHSVHLTPAEGGALTWRPIESVDNDWLYQQFQLLSLHGQSKDALAKTQLGAWEYDIVSPAYKCNMTDIMAGIRLAQFDRYESILQRRRQIIERYDDAFCGCPVQLLEHYTADNQSSGHLYMVRLPDRDIEFRNQLIIRMTERGIACNVHYKPLPMMTAYRKLGFDIADYPNAYRMYQNEITLPLHTCLTDEEVEYVVFNFIELMLK